MTRKFSTSFDELMKQHYGRAIRPEKTLAAQTRDLFASHYGQAPACGNGRNGRNGRALVLSRSCDNGEVIVPGAAASKAPDDSEYIVAPRHSPAKAVEGRTDVRTPEAVTPFEEYRVDVLRPLAQTPAPAPAPAPRPVTPVAENPPQMPAPAALPRGEDTPHPKPTGEADFIADMQSILSGGKVFDPKKKATVPREQAGRWAGDDGAHDIGDVPAPGAKNGQEIFDRIALSMEFANKYDLGTVELKNRFADFDQMSDIRERAAQTKKSAPVPAPAGAVNATSPTPFHGAEFIEDLAAIRPPQPAAVPQAATASLYTPGHISRPFYDTGEHVLAGDDLYVDQLRVGKAPGVAFSYGQIIGMADLYESADQMMGADAAELSTLKGLIERSTAYHRENRADASLDVSTDAWETATSRRFLRLAERNYQHFSPNPLAADRTFSRIAPKFGTNKSTWEEQHTRAIDEARRMFLAQPPGTSAPLAEWPLIINAFGDHFLTDAFAAGHLINKEATIQYFKDGFFSGPTLTPQGKEFFKKVALLAFTGDVAQKFSALETVDYPVCAAGWCFKWHPNISTWERLAEVLSAAAEQQADSIGNVCVLALHDKLNGAADIEVLNKAGDAPWKLTGDGTLNAANLAIMRRAVKQSVDNITDGSIFGSNIDYAAYCAKVWKHVPQLTEASQRRIATLTTVYTRPDSDILVNAAATIVQRRVNELIASLVAANKLKRA